MPFVRIDALGAGRDPLGALYDPDYLDVHRDGVAQSRCRQYQGDLGVFGQPRTLVASLPW